jgi:hypothetical protein
VQVASAMLKVRSLGNVDAACEGAEDGKKRKEKEQNSHSL